MDFFGKTSIKTKVYCKIEILLKKYLKINQKIINKSKKIVDQK